jgi:hypothetical protein
MNSREDTESSAAHAPLLAQEPLVRQHEDQPKHSSGRFIWYLTFSAGISGLLFGYEYVLRRDIELWSGLTATAPVSYRPRSYLSTLISRTAPLQPWIRV